MNTQVFAWSHDCARPPSLPMTTWFEFAGSTQIGVVVGVDRRGRLRVDRLAAVGRHLQVDAAHVDDFGIVRIDASPG